MPRKQSARVKARPDITFINSYSETGDANARLIARRHASYWGHRKSRAQVALTSSPSYGSSPSTTDASIGESPENDDSYLSYGAALMSLERAESRTPVNFHFGSSFDSFQCLPQIWTPPGQEAPPDLLSVNSIMLDFFGESFIRRTILRSGEYCNIRYAGCLLLCYAYYMAMTGNGSYESFMRLKGNVIELVRQAVADPGKTPTLDTMIAVMALGTPIVCQVTNPAVKLTQTESSPSESALVATSPSAASAASDESTSTEYDMHYQAITRLLRMQRDPAYLTTSDGRFVFLVKVISSAHRMLTLDDVDTESWLELFRKFELYNTDSRPESCWNSPLFGPPRSLVPKPANTPLQNRCLELAAAMRDWFLQYKKMRRRMPNEIDFVRGRLEHKLSTKNLAGSATDTDESILDACFITATIMTEASDRGCSLAVAAGFVPRSAELPYILKKTDLLHLWGDLCGLLYWVTLVCHVICQSSQERSISTFVLAHFTQMFAASQIPLSAALAPIKEFLEYP